MFTFSEEKRLLEGADEGERTANGEAGGSTIWQLKNYHFINIMHY